MPNATESIRGIHALNAGAFRPGDVFGWSSPDSPTGFFSGIVERTGPCTVYVRNVQLGIVSRPGGPADA